MSAAVINRQFFMDRITVDSEGLGCWIWNGTTNDNGYGKWGRFLTHRLAYQTFVGPIPAGLQINHHCDVRPCCNPDHIYAGTQAENIADASRRGRLKSRRVRIGDEIPTALPRATVVAAREMYATGAYSKADVATHFGLDLHTLRNWLGGLRAEFDAMPTRDERFRDIACGTMSGYRRHSRKHEPSCLACRQARSEDRARKLGLRPSEQVAS